MPAILTIPSNCRDCYKCVRHCPVKAIKVEGNHTEIEESLCISCAECFNVCPQHAKVVRDDRPDVLKALYSGKKVVLSLAPSFSSSFPGDEAFKLIGAAKKAGFSYITETSSAAKAVAEAHARFAEGQQQGPLIATACPVVVNLVERYYPESVRLLAPVASPMITHMRWLKDKFGEECFTVFAGPCVAKKQEAERAEYKGLTDAVLTFSELLSVFDKRGVEVGSCLAVKPDNTTCAEAAARHFPLEGGLIRSAGDGKGRDVAITGIDDCREALEHIEDYSDVRILEMMACRGGCLSGPASTSGAGNYAKRRSTEGFSTLLGDCGSEGIPLSMTEASYSAKDARWPEPAEGEVARILELTGKYKPEDELNCGACGYFSCQEKAKAVIRGLAEPEMCMPYMKSRAETMGNLVVNETPNGIIGVKPDMTVVMTNPALCRFTGMSADQLIGRQLPAAFEKEPFTQVFEMRKTLIRDASGNAGIGKSREAYFHLQSKDMVVLLISDLTSEHNDKEALVKARRETAEKAGRVIDNQIRVAQQVAGLMGEAAAETKVLLSRLIKQLEEGSDR